MIVEVAMAMPNKQQLARLEVASDTTATQAVAQADLPSLFPELPASLFQQLELGIFGKVLRHPQDYRLRDGDRVEVYRPLIIDPKDARRRRARRQRGG